MTESPPFPSLQDLHNGMRACRLCLEAGYEIFPRAIFSGRIGAKVMIIGQAPGITEKEAGRPFNAGSGTRLFQWLEAAGFKERAFRENQYMTSVTKCYPGRSPSGSGDRVPSKVEQALCRPFLNAEISLIDPAIILPVGRLAINLFFNPKQKLSDLIGTEHQMDGRRILPLPHPSGASRWHQLPENRARIEFAVKTLEKLRAELGP